MPRKVRIDMIDNSSDVGNNTKRVELLSIDTKDIVDSRRIIYRQANVLNTTVN